MVRLSMAVTSAPDSESALWLKRFWWLLAAVLIVRVGVTLLFAHGADLAGDEAYYWDWGRRPDWGYYSKPPMIGWMMGAIGWLTGNAELGIRFASLLLGTFTLFIVHRMALVLFDARTAFLTALLVLLTIANAGLNLLLTIDAPLLLCWTTGLLLFWFAAQKPTCNVRWLALALVIGIGTLSKQMMLAFPALMLAFAAVSREDRALLKNWRMWAAILLGMAFIIPVLKWNQKHAWITLEHTKHHFDGETRSFGKWISRTLENVGLQALIYTPVTFIALIAAMRVAVRERQGLSRAALFVMIACVPGLVLFALLSLRQRINPNWPAAFFVPAFVLVAAWMRGLLPGPSASPGWQKWSLRVGGTLVLLVHIGLVVVFSTDLKGLKKLADIRGWREAGIEAQKFLDQVPQPQKTFVMAMGHRYHAAQMAFYMPSHPRLYRWEPSGTPQSQYEIWPGPEERLGYDALILEPSAGEGMLLSPDMVAVFEKVERMGTIRIPLGQTQREFAVYLGRDLKSWKVVKAGSEQRMTNEIPVTRR